MDSPFLCRETGHVTPKRHSHLCRCPKANLWQTRPLSLIIGQAGWLWAQTRQNTCSKNCSSVSDHYVVPSHSIEEVKVSGISQLGNTSEGRLARTGSLSMALQVLRRHRKAMHTKEIAEHIFQEFHVRVNKWSLGTLWRHIKNHPDSPFYKPKRTSNTYASPEALFRLRSLR